jgi:hypothetical protein
MDSTTLLFITQKKGGVPVAQAHEVIVKIIETINAKRYAYDDGELRKDNPYKKLYDLLESLLREEKFFGDDTDFHNIAVELANNDDEDYACDFLEIGLRKYPASVDLLADYIKYCISCERVEKGKEYFECLQNIDKNQWTWRGFQFSYEFMRRLKYDKGDEHIETEDIENMVAEYKRRMPRMDAAYDIEYDFSLLINGQSTEESEMEKLENLLKNQVGKLERTPKCSYRLMKHSFDKKEYQKALEYAARCIEDSVLPHSGISRTYVYFIRVLCNMSIIFKEVGTTRTDLESIKGTDKEKLLLNIYADAETIRRLEGGDSGGSMYKDVKPFIEELSKQTGIPFYDNN